MTSPDPFDKMSSAFRHQQARLTSRMARARAYVENNEDCTWLFNEYADTLQRAQQKVKFQRSTLRQYQTAILQHKAQIANLQHELAQREAVAEAERLSGAVSE